MSNFDHGLSTVTKYSGSTTSDLSLGANTKFIKRTAVIHCDAQTSETTTAFTFPDVAIAHDVYIYVHTIDDTETVDVGTVDGTDDPNGFLAGASLGTLGLVYGSLADGAVTRGELLYEITEAITAAARKPAINVGGDTVSYTCSAGSDTAVFDIIIEYTEVVEG